MPAVVADERYKSAAFQHLHGKSIPALFDEPQFLMFRIPNGKNHPAALGKLGKERFRNRRSGGSNEDGVERSEFREAQRAVAAMNVRIGVAQPSQLGGSAGSQLRPPFDRENFVYQARKHGS